VSDSSGGGNGVSDSSGGGNGMTGSSGGASRDTAASLMMPVFQSNRCDLPSILLIIF
jgi:hypothetical protein